MTVATPRTLPPPPSGGGSGSAAPADLNQSAFSRRLVRLMGLRLLVLTLFLAFITLVYLRGQTGGFSSLVAFLTVAGAYALAAVYTTLLSRGKYLVQVAYAQIVTDQLVWTAIVYITGGATSGGVSLYGLTCFAAAVALGRRGAVVGLVGALICYIALTAGLLYELLPIPPDQDVYATELSQVAFPVLANACGLALVAAMSGYLAERLRTAGGDLAVAEARAEEAERLAVLGRLAMGLAHEIRNPLGGILGSVELLRTSPGLTEEDRQLCEIVQREASRLNDLVGDMLDLSRQRSPQLEQVDVAQLGRELATLASQSGRGGDVVVHYLGAPRCYVKADASQLRQVLWNLVRNAVQASSAGDEVVLRVERRDRKVAIEVCDAGPGIAPEAMSKIFDAFFTTRSHGTGVGLAVVRRIVDAHHWTIEVVSSDEAKGATFRVLAPEAEVDEVSAAALEDTAEAALRQPAGTEQEAEVQPS